MKPFYPNLEKRAATFLLWIIILLMLANPIVRRWRPEAAFSPLRLAAMCLAWMASFGMAWAASLGAHLRVTLVEAGVSGPNRLRLRRFADAAFFVFSLAMAAVGCLALADSLAEGWSAWSRSLVLAAIPVGSLLACLRLLERLLGGARP